MNKKSTYDILVKEGAVANYLDVLEEKFGGHRNENSYEVNSAGNRIKVSIYHLLPDFELLLLRSYVQKDLNVNRLPDERADYFHLTLIKEGQYDRHYVNNTQQADAGGATGLFLHNGLFKLNTSYPAHTDLHSVSVKFSKAAFETILPDAKGLLHSLFPDDEPKWYHTYVSPELQKLSEDVFYLEDASFGSKGLVMARGLELFVLLMSALSNQLKQDDLNGLHKDDYQRVIDIKNFVLTQLEGKINMEDIAQRFAISPSKLKRDFQTLYNCSVSQFYTHAKMDEAYRRLQSGNYSVTAVGYDLGYQNVSKFSTMFKKIKGISPKDVIPL
ncbi:helix-turn-helix transcriptional regulator [Carboxylicivirga mesophila]|uniref:Helix-turn-helix transcriptional regulator n=1 Tax=Carboxylicivirga mesophila TaxID=1166478 RepID=A0ABS5KAK3_9BACT|nr:AraC family transcriptional regulator [Carboxylicivirga mesophila]MBS2211976.1 helix-turn-helix transcriptional regulator [Carboxylicivirga mesophila]